MACCLLGRLLGWTVRCFVDWVFRFTISRPNLTEEHHLALCVFKALTDKKYCFLNTNKNEVKSIKLHI
jgi:hypothetical protein